MSYLSYLSYPFRKGRRLSMGARIRYGPSVVGCLYSTDEAGTMGRYVRLRELQPRWVRPQIVQQQIRKARCAESVSPKHPPADKAFLLAGPHLQKRGNQSARGALIRRMQQVYGNRAVQRLLRDGMNAAGNRAALDSKAGSEATNIPGRNSLRQPATLHNSASGSVQRKLRVGGTDLDAHGVSQLTNDLISTKLRDIVSKVVSADLVRETVREMQAVSDILEFADADAVATDVRQRVLVSHYMRVSQGSTPLRKAFSYPDRAGDGTAGVGPKVNDAAAAYWGPVQNDYYFDLSPAGVANPYDALIKLFTEQTNPHKRTLIHCDYVLSVLQFRSFAESIGIPRFNAMVQFGALTAPGEGPMRLKWNGFDELLKTPAVRVGPFAIPLMANAPLKDITITDKSALIIGDHVRFYNHATYDALIEQVGGVWRLENAIVIDRVGGRFRFQGHGYFSPVTEDVLLDGMIRQYNSHVDEALAIVHRVDQGSPASRAKAETERLNRYGNVVRKSGGGWRVKGEGLCGTVTERDLKHLTRAEAPGLIDPCSGTIEVRRPVEQH